MPEPSVFIKPWREVGVWLPFLLTQLEVGDPHCSFSQVSLWFLDPTILESLYKKLKPVQVLRREFLKMNLLAL